jgi:hypothetical protein
MRSPRRVPRPARGPIILLAAICGCASIRLNNAMNDRVHVHYLDLLYLVENRDLARVPAAARALSGALDDPAIAAYSSDAEFQEFLAGTRKIADELAAGEGSLDEKSADRLRKRLGDSCESCHRAYRR